MVSEPLRLESVLVILIDVAEGPLSSVRSIAQSELRRNAGALAELCVLLDIPVLQAKAPLPAAAAVILPEVAQHLVSTPEVVHATNDAWQTRAFVEAVQKTGRQQLVFAGIATDVGVALTALSAVRSGYQAAALTDVCGTISDRAEQAALWRMTQAGIVLTTWSAFAGEVQRNYTEGKGAEVLQLLGRTFFQGTTMSGTARQAKGESTAQSISLEAARILVAKVQAADAALNVEAFVSLLTPDVVFRIGSQPILQGREAVRSAINGLFALMRRIEHHTLDLWVEGDRIALQAEVTFAMTSGNEVTLPYMNVLSVEDQYIRDYRIHIDLQPVLASINTDS